MRNVKTAISIPADLFKQIDRAAKKNGVPRSWLFAEGARKVLRDMRNDEMTARLNKVYADPEVQSEQVAWARAGSASLARILELEKDEW